jgi:hypothetical protein
VAGPSITTEAYILQKASPRESFQPGVAYSAEHGNLRILQRIPRKAKPDHITLDLFDQVALVLDSGSHQTWFVKEVRLLHRHTGIGRNYRRLQHAAAFTALIARNPVHEESREAVAELIASALAAFADSDRPDIVGFKSLYLFSRDEGYPLKEHWFPTLPRDDRSDVVTLLNRPTAEAAESVQPARVSFLHQRMEDYLRGHTDILVD